MEEINIKDLIYFLKKRIYIIIALAILSFIIGVVYTYWIQVPVYNSQTTLLLVPTASTVTQNDVLLNQKLVTTYSEIVRSNKVMGRVIEELKLKYSIKELSSNVKVTAVKDTEIIRISVSDKTPARARNIANRVVVVFCEEIVNLYNIENIGVIDVASTPTVPYNVSVGKQLSISIVAGIAIGVVIIFVWFYFDTTVRSIEQIEEKIELPIIGAVPVRRKKRVKYE